MVHVYYRQSSVNQNHWSAFDQHLIGIRSTLNQNLDRHLIDTPLSVGWHTAECQLTRTYRSTLDGVSAKIRQCLTNNRPRFWSSDNWVSTDVSIDTQPWIPFSTHDPKIYILTPKNVIENDYEGEGVGLHLEVVAVELKLKTFPEEGMASSGKNTISPGKCILVPSPINNGHLILHEKPFLENMVQLSLSKQTCCPRWRIYLPRFPAGVSHRGN